MPTIQTAMTDANATSLANGPSDTTPFVRLKGVLRMTGLGRTTPVAKACALPMMCLSNVGVAPFEEST